MTKSGANSWIKRRTSRGGGRPIHSGKKSLKNIEQDIRKNQIVYSLYLWKFVAIFFIGLIWSKLGVGLNIVGAGISALPIGFALGLVIIVMEKFSAFKKFEFTILLISTITSYFWPIALVF